MQSEGQGEASGATAARPPSELLSRILSGLLLGAITIGVAWAGLKPFALLVLVVALVMSWEWGRVVRGVDSDLTFVVHAVAVVIAIALAAFVSAALGVAALAIGSILALSLQFGERGLLSAAGVLYTGLPAVSLLWLMSDGEPWGFRAVLFILVLVWATDTFAYVAGRLIGGPKLMPTVSPNKTWSGLAGGVGASAATAAAFASFIGAPALVLALSGLVLGLVAQAGDLAESALKRHFGVKDASNIIPGHGGFMDRMDGVVTVAVAAALFALFKGPSAPAQALFLGF
jgi:phosphatidate cytidylyltransferase